MTNRARRHTPHEVSPPTWWPCWTPGGSIGRTRTGHEAWDRLPEITAPTLLIHGSADLVNPTANTPLMAARIPGAQVYIVEGGRHGYFEEHRERVSRVVLEFLAEHPIERARLV